MLVRKKLEFDCAEINLLDSGIILLRYKSEYEVELDDVIEIEKVLIELTDNGDIYTLMDTSGRFNNFSSEAQKYLSKDALIVKNKKIKGSAVVIDSLPNRLMARFFSNFFKPQFPMMVFPNQEEGIKWLKSLM